MNFTKDELINYIKRRQDSVRCRDRINSRERALEETVLRAALVFVSGETTNALGFGVPFGTNKIQFIEPVDNRARIKISKKRLDELADPHLRSVNPPSDNEIAELVRAVSG